MSKKIRPSDWEQLEIDYNRDNAWIKQEKIKWLPPREKRMARLPNRSEMSTKDAPADQFQGADHTSPKTNNTPNDPQLNKVKKASGGKPPMSPIMQVMKAVTQSALNPKRKKATKMGSGDKINTDSENPKRPANAIYKNQG